MSRLRVLKALARFDVATTDDISRVLSGTKQAAAHHLRRLVADGLATRLGTSYARYSVTDAGRAQAKAAA